MEVTEHGVPEIHEQQEIGENISAATMTAGSSSSLQVKPDEDVEMEDVGEPEVIPSHVSLGRRVSGT